MFDLGEKMPNPRDPGGALSEQNRAMFRGTIPREMWGQMNQYGLGQTDQFPDWRSIKGISEAEMPLLEALMMAFQEEQSARRPKVKGQGVVIGDPQLNEANRLAGR
jgi:hypothetical protein